MSFCVTVNKRELEVTVKLFLTFIATDTGLSQSANKPDSCNYSVKVNDVVFVPQEKK